MSKPSDVVGWLGSGEIYTVVDWRARAEKAEAELARLTTLRPASEHDGRTSVLIWDEAFDGGWYSGSVEMTVPHYSMWTPLPEPKEAEK